MNRIKRNLQQFRNWARNLRRNWQRKSQKAQAKPKPQTSQPKKASNDNSVSKLNANAKKQAVQAGKALQQNGVSQGQNVTRVERPGVTPNMHQAKPNSSGSSWKHSDSMHRGKQAGKNTRKGKSL